MSESGGGERRYRLLVASAVRSRRLLNPMTAAREEDPSEDALQDSLLPAEGGAEQGRGGTGEERGGESEEGRQPWPWPLRSEDRWNLEARQFSARASQLLAAAASRLASFALRLGRWPNVGGLASLPGLPQTLTRICMAARWTVGKFLKSAWAAAGAAAALVFIALGLWLRRRQLRAGGDRSNSRALQSGWPKLSLSALSALALKPFVRSFGNENAPTAEIPFSTLFRQVSLGGVAEVTYTGGGRVFASLKSESPNHEGKGPRRVTAALVPGSEGAFFREVACKVPSFKNKPQPTLMDAASFCFPLVVLGVWWRLLRSLVEQQQSPPSQSDNLRHQARGAPRPLRFSDVVCDEKRELEELVQYLRNKTQLHELERRGGRLPRGVLLVGPPGTGKTSLARALAAEGKVAFLGAAAAEFVEIYVGQGAKRVREIFREARRKAPCVLFLDEIDAFGSRGRAMRGSPLRRGSGGSSSEEYIQTLNQLLFEMDGLYEAKGVLVLAATNRLHAVDAALLRSGRFDRIVHLRLPHLAQRREILKQLAATRGLCLADDAAEAIEKVARESHGFSGADLENLVNESVLLAARYKRRTVEGADLHEALERIRTRPGNESDEAGQSVPGRVPSERPSVYDEF